MSAASEYDYDNPDFGPLQALVPTEQISDWMWMNRSTTDGRVVEHYKHRIARAYINLDHNGQAWQSQISDYGCTPWCGQEHQHLENTYEHFPVPAARVLDEVRSWLS